jgi:hypothetical protein
MVESLVERITRITSEVLSEIVILAVAVFLLSLLSMFIMESQTSRDLLSAAKSASGSVFLFIVMLIVFYIVPFCLLLFLPVFFLLVKGREDRNKLLILYAFVLIMVTVFNGYLSARLFD